VWVATNCCELNVGFTFHSFPFIRRQEINNTSVFVENSIKMVLSVVYALL